MIFINPYSFNPSVSVLSDLDGLLDELREKEENEYTLTFVSAEDASEIPTTGSSLIVIAKIADQIHVRVFNAAGETKVDKCESELAGNPRIQKLKSALLLQDSPNKTERRGIIDCAAKASGYEIPEDRNAFIDRKRDESWGLKAVLDTLRSAVGNKCWYSEVSLDGSDPDVDHFFPKGRVREIDGNFVHTNETSPGYWWFAFEFRNFRLTCKHSNQRRVDPDTDGGKWDYFPIRKPRADELTPWETIKSIEDPLPLDPCSISDASLLCFDSDGMPCASDRANDSEKERVKLSIWLYHLKKEETRISRTGSVQSIQADLRAANTNYIIWNRETDRENLQAKEAFDANVAKINAEIDRSSVFAGAKQCAVRLAMSKYKWIPEFIPLPHYE